jgi:hypothetical protein
LLAAWLLVFPLNPPDDYVGTGSEGGLEELVLDSCFLLLSYAFFLPSVIQMEERRGIFFMLAGT